MKIYLLEKANCNILFVGGNIQLLWIPPPS
jgi:hypothetical protein